ncbi:MAG: endolytic transglycosylase MltG, partial [SAR324 cluster bacterium]|nr:endolytic transglycosylase MltG [SAR324 cluster bacterium]
MMRSPFKSFVVGLVLALVGGIWAIGSYIYVVFEKPIAPNPEGSSILLIPRGTPYSQVKKELQELGLVNQPRLFRYLSLYLNVASRIRAGEFELQHRWNTWQLLQHLTRGKSITHRVTIPEGWNFEEIVERLVNKDLGDREVFLSLFKDSDLLQITGVQEAPSLEGFLFPETY